MIFTKVTSRYAKAILDLAIIDNQLEGISKDLEFVHKSILSNRELYLLIKNPIIKRDKKIKIFKEIFQNKISETSLKFFDLVIRRQREDILLEIISKFFELRDEYLNLKNVFVKTAFDLDKNHIEELKAVLESNLGKKVRLNLFTDKKLVGGFIVQIDDTVIDASIKNQLELLKKRFLTGTEKMN